MAWLRRRYGAGPLHLLGLVASFALAGYAAVRVVPNNPVGIIAWFVGAAVVHDLVLWPIYGGLDRAAQAAAGDRGPAVPWINYVRIPAVLSGMLLLISFPLVFRFPPGFQGITGTTTEPYLGHWLLITAVLFGGSALAYGLRLARVARASEGDSGQASA